MPVEAAQGSTGSGNAATPAGIRSAAPATTTPANPATRGNTLIASLENIASQTPTNGVLSNEPRLSNEEILHATHLRLAQMYNFQV